MEVVKRIKTRTYVTEGWLRCKGSYIALSYDAYSLNSEEKANVSLSIAQRGCSISWLHNNSFCTWANILPCVWYVHVPLNRPRYMHIPLWQAEQTRAMVIYLYEHSTYRYVRLNALNRLQVHGPSRFNAPFYWHFLLFTT